jgi:hypothetical protein
MDEQSFYLLKIGLVIKNIYRTFAIKRPKT